MKQNIYIAALLAGMLALAGCGGGGSAQEPVINDPPLGQDDCDAGTIFSEGACLTQGQIADAAEQATEEAAKEVAATIVTNAKAAIAAAETLAAVDAVIGGLDQGAISQEDYAALQGEATARKGSISAAAVQAAKDAINAAGKDADVDFQLRTAKENNPNILATAHDELEMAAENRKTAIQMAADQQRNSDSATAVQAAIDKIKAASTIEDVEAAEAEADGNAAILQSEKDKDADDAGSYQMAAADRIRALENPIQKEALMMAEQGYAGALREAEGAGDAVEQGQIDAVDTALETLKTRIAEATAVSEADKADAVQHRDDADDKIAALESRRSQVDALKAAEATVIRLTGWTQDGSFGGFQPTRAEHTAIDNAVQALRALLEDESDNVVDNGMYWTTVLLAEGWAEGQDDRLTALETDQQNQDSANALAMTLKLWDAIGKDGNKGTATVDGDGMITVDRDGNSSVAVVALTESSTSVASLHGWEGSEQTGKPAENAAGDSGTYTARLYSNVGEANDGGKFNADGTLDADDDGTFDSGVLTFSNGGQATRVASPKFDSEVPSVGPKFYGLPDPNPQQATRIKPIEGKYYGVSGSYTCAPTNDDACSVTKKSGGYMLAGAWTFTPNDPEDTVTEMPDTVYEVYGWWLHEDANGKATASAFQTKRGDPSAGRNALALVGLVAGTATYKGGAAGKYAIRAGSTNDAGHFIADATLEADFEDDMVSGTINNFRVGDDEDSRDWSIALEKSGFDNGSGLIKGSNGTGTAKMTTWKMKDTDTNATKSGAWEGQFYSSIPANMDGAGTPRSATGIFHSEYNNTGRMVGAFGVSLDN